MFNTLIATEARVLIYLQLGFNLQFINNISTILIFGQCLFGRYNKFNVK